MRIRKYNFTEKNKNKEVPVFDTDRYRLFFI